MRVRVCTRGGALDNEYMPPRVVWFGELEHIPRAGDSLLLHRTILGYIVQAYEGYASELIHEIIWDLAAEEILVVLEARSLPFILYPPAVEEDG